jgi:hypothetical protein
MTTFVTAKDGLDKNVSLFMAIYMITVPIKFFIFYWNYPKVCKLIRLIVSKLKATSMERAKQDEMGIENFAKVVWKVLLISFIPYVYYLTQTTPQNWIDITTQITSLPSGFALEFTNFMLQFIYFNLCIQVCSLLKQIEDELKETRLIRDKKRLTEMLGAIVELHQEVHEIIQELLDCFKYILSLNFLLNIWLVGQSLIFSSDSDWLVVFLTSPFLLFEAWIYCYSSQSIITRV